MRCGNPGTGSQPSTLNPQPTPTIMSKQVFDLICLEISGNTFIVPRDAGMAVFALFSNHDVYRKEYEWKASGNSIQYASLLQDGAVKLSSIGPVEFAALRVAAEAKEQRDAAERRAKEAA
jgi:hypothetical protein